MAKMIKYQDPNFNKDQYWLDRKANAADKRAKRIGKRYSNVVAVHASPDWPRKEPTAKAIKKQTKRGRRVISYAS